MKKKDFIIGLIAGILFFCSTFITTIAFALPTFEFFVEDSSQPTPKKVGFVITISTEADPRSLAFPQGIGSFTGSPRHILSLLPIPKAPEPVSKEDFWKLGLLIQPDEIPYAGSIFFTSFDCSGTPWIGEFQINAEFDPTFDPHVVIRDSIDPNIRKLYVPDPTAPLSQMMNFNSVLQKFNSSGGCDSVVRNMRAKPAILLDADLHTTYPPPYKLQFDVIP